MKNENILPAGKEVHKRYIAEKIAKYLIAKKKVALILLALLLLSFQIGIIILVINNVTSTESNEDAIPISIVVICSILFTFVFFSFKHSLKDFEKIFQKYKKLLKQL